MNSKEIILNRLRGALQAKNLGASGISSAAAMDYHQIPRDYIQVGTHSPGSAALITQFTHALEDYGASVIKVDTEDDIPGAIVDLLDEAEYIVMPIKVPPAWIKAVMGRHLVYLDSRDSPLTHTQLNTIDAVVTKSFCAVASTGSIILNGGPGQGRRAITLIPDRHIAVVSINSIVETVPEAFALIGEQNREPLTWISGPSATSDIEMTRVEGVHGPRSLKVILAP